MLGQTTVEKQVGADSSMNVQMEDDAQALEEVIVTGQGSGIQRRKLSTTTVDVLNEEDIEKLPSNQIDQMLQATAPSAPNPIKFGPARHGVDYSNKGCNISRFLLYSCNHC